MSYCIITRYHGPTDYRGSRIIATGPSAHLDGATCEHGPSPVIAAGKPTRATVPFDYAGPGADGNPRRAALAVAEKLRAHGWNVTVADTGYRLPDDDATAWPLVYDRGEPADWTVTAGRVLECNGRPVCHLAPEGEPGRDYQPARMDTLARTVAELLTANRQPAPRP